MKIELSKIPESGLIVNQDIILDKKLFKDADILDIKKIYFDGIINFDYEGHLVINGKLNGVFILEDAVTLDPVDYSFVCLIEENIKNIENLGSDFYEKSKNILDISEVLWENIVLEIPISVSKANSDDLSLRGDGWELKSESGKEIDPRLAKLKELFNEKEE